MGDYLILFQPQIALGFALSWGRERTDGAGGALSMGLRRPSLHTVDGWNPAPGLRWLKHWNSWGTFIPYISISKIYEACPINNESYEPNARHALQTSLFPYLPPAAERQEPIPGSLPCNCATATWASSAGSTDFSLKNRCGSLWGCTGAKTLRKFGKHIDSNYISHVLS